jgi:YVTN family beta-propeller protein
MDVEILGSLVLRGRDGREIRLPAGRERALFVLLLIHRGEVVSIDRIVDALWGEHPPGTATKAVQGYVSHLRRVLEPDDESSESRGLLVTQAPGYALRTDAVTVDATRFERLAEQARRALEDGSAAEAHTLLGEALALWRGPALAEFAFDDFARDEIHRLEELRLSATEDGVESLLQLGGHGELVGQLASLVAAHPLRERLRGQWMLALYRSGRQADALEAYRDGRRLLAGSLGLEPGPHLQRLERAILAQDPELEPPPAAALPRSSLSGSPPAKSARTRRRRLLAIVAALAAVALLAVALVFAFARERAPSPFKVVAPAAVAVDAKTDKVVASIPVGSEPVSITSGNGAIWVGDVADGTVTRIDPVSRRVVKTIGIGAPAVDLASSPGNVWASTGGFGTIVRIDSHVNAITDRFSLATSGDPIVPTASAIAVVDGRVWVGAFDGLALLDPRSRKIVKVDLGQTPALETAVGDGAVWATLITNRAQRVDAVSGKVTAPFYAGTFALGIAMDASAVWVAGAGVGELWKLDPLTGAQLLTTHAGNGATAVALGAGAVWVASWRDQTLVRVDPATGDVTATIPIGGEPQDLVVRDGLVWVVVRPAPPAS